MALLMSAQNVAGTASGRKGEFGQSMFRSDVGYVHIDCSGNSASATLLASPDGASRWMAVTSWAMGPGTTATAQVQSFLPYVAAQLEWASGGTRTGTVTFYYDGRLGNEG